MSVWQTMNKQLGLQKIPVEGFPKKQSTEFFATTIKQLVIQYNKSSNHYGDYIDKK